MTSEGPAQKMARADPTRPLVAALKRLARTRVRMYMQNSRLS